MKMKLLVLSMVCGVGLAQSAVASACSSDALVDAAVAVVNQMAQGTHGTASDIEAGVFGSGAGLQVVVSYKLHDPYTPEPISRIALAQFDPGSCQLTILNAVNAQTKVGTGN